MPLSNFDARMTAYGTSRASRNVRLESAKWARADIDQVVVTDSRFYEYTSFSILPLAYYGGFDDFELPKMIDLRPTPRHLQRKKQFFG
jgi:hypothetical protein